LSSHAPLILYAEGAEHYFFEFRGVRCYTGRAYNSCILRNTHTGPSQGGQMGAMVQTIVFLCLCSPHSLPSVGPLLACLPILGP